MTENSYVGPQICYICNATTDFYSRNLYVTKSKHTNTKICDLIKRWLENSSISRPIVDASDENCICIDCLDKINEFDSMYANAMQMEKEIQKILLTTESLLKQVCEQEATVNGTKPGKKASILVLDPCTGYFVESYENAGAEDHDSAATDNTGDGLDNKECNDPDLKDVKRIHYVFFCTICNTELNR